MKKILSFFFMMAFIGGSLLLPGCEVDYYEPSEDDQGTGSSLFGEDVTVPSGFDWATTHTVNVSVKVDDQYNGNYYYTVELFDANPLFDENATLLSKGVAKKNNDFSVAVALPQATETVYVQQTNPTGKMTIAAVDIVSSSLSYEFTTVGPTLRSASAGVNETGGSYSLRAASDQYTLPSNAKKVTQTSGLLNLNLNDGPYLIDGSFSGTTNFWGVGEIYVTGTFEVSGGFQIPAKSKLFVLQGGTFKTGGDLDVSGEAFFYNNGNGQVNGLLKTSNPQAIIINDHILRAQKVEIVSNTASMTNNGTLEISDNVKISNNGKIVNTNSITAQSLTFDNGNFENDGITTIQGHTAATNNTVNFVNSNSFTTNTMFVSSSATIRNNCHMVINGLLEVTDAKLFVGGGALLTTETLLMKNTRIELGSAAMMHVRTLATFKYNISPNGFYGTGTNKALLKISRAVQYDESYPIIHYQGNLEIECYDHPAENVDSSNKRWTQSGVTWAGEGGSSLVIPATDCNNGGNNSVVPGTPANPVFPVIFNGSVLTYLFEDNWPYLGDYDMNDVVLDVKPTYSLNSSNKVTGLELDVTLRAVGASKRLAAGLQLDGIIRGSISSITRNKTTGLNGNVFTQSNGLETNQKYEVIPLFDDVHEALGLSSPIMINTIKSNEKVPSGQVIFTITFNTPLDMASITVDKFNVFIVNGGYKDKRQEVHMPGFQPTDKVDKNKFGKADDNSNVKLYTSKENMIWGLAIPGPAKYPVEFKSILLAYPDLESWATSGGTNAKDWYKNFNENVYN